MKLCFTYLFERTYRSSENWYTRIFCSNLSLKLRNIKLLTSIWLIACINYKYNDVFPSVLLDTSYFANFTATPYGNERTAWRNTSVERRSQVFFTEVTANTAAVLADTTLLPIHSTLSQHWLRRVGTWSWVQVGKDANTGLV